MTDIKRIFRAFLLLNKRLMKKSGFVAILLLVPVLTLAMTLVSREENGLMKIMLAAENGDDQTALEIMKELKDDGKMIDFRICDGEEEAVAEVTHGNADAAWVFLDGCEERLAKFAENPTVENALVKAVEREDTATLKMAREKLYSVVYSHYSYGIYHDYVRENVEKLDKMTDEEVKSYYDSFTMNDELFSYAYSDGVERPEGDNTDYLVSPLRGMLAVLVALCSFAVAMYYLNDLKNGTFVWIPNGAKPLFSAGYHLTAVADAGIAVLLALFISGIADIENFGRELLAMVVYVLAETAFCILVRHLTGGIKALGTLTPVLVLIHLILCPVFLNIGSGSVMLILKHLFPATYYLKSVYNLRYAGYLLIYTAVVFTADLVIYKVKAKRAKA